MREFNHWIDHHQDTRNAFLARVWTKRNGKNWIEMCCAFHRMTWSPINYARKKNDIARRHCEQNTAETFCRKRKWQNATIKKLSLSSTPWHAIYFEACEYSASENDKMWRACIGHLISEWYIRHHLTHEVGCERSLANCRCSLASPSYNIFNNLFRMWIVRCVVAIKSYTSLYSTIIDWKIELVDGSDAKRGMYTMPSSIFASM